MAFIKKEDLKSILTTSRAEARVWREGYKEFERLMDNGLLTGIDPSLPEVNDGSLAAALFKLPKRIVSSDLSGTAKAIDRDEAWVSQLVDLVWQNDIVPHANSQAPFHRKWKDAVRKAAGYGSVPLITLFVETEGKRHADFIVGQPQDVILEAGKVSDYDSDILFWDLYYSKSQLESMIEQAEYETKNQVKNKDDAVNKWNIVALKEILEKDQKEEREAVDTPEQQQNRQVKPSGFKFTLAVQRGVDAPYYMYYSDTKETVREWSNPDPTGDVCIHFLYCYQDFINPYGTGIVKLAGGTQNVLDYMRQADVLATQLGLKPPIAIEGTEEEVDIDSIVYAQDAIWFTGGAKVVRQELANGVYSQLPERMSMYKTSLNQLIPTGDTSIQSTAGDPNYSKTPAGVKFQAASLSIDDEDFKDNLYMTFAAVAKSMINIHFANMEGTDLLKLSADQRDILIKAGMQFPMNENGEMSKEVEIKWDDMRGKFDFEVNPEQNKATDDADKLKGLLEVLKLTVEAPTLDQELQAVGKRLNKGELLYEIINLTTDSDKIITDISGEDGQVDEEQPEQMPQDQAQTQEPQLPVKASVNYKDAPPSIQRQMEQADGWQPATDEEHSLQQASHAADAITKAKAITEPNKLEMATHQHTMQQEAQANQAAQTPQEPAKETKGKESDLSPEDMQVNIEAVMQTYGVDENTAMTALAAEHEGLPVEEIIKYLQQYQQQVQQGEGGTQ